MSYWRGLFVAAAMDLVWISGCPSRVSGPAQPPAAPPRAVAGRAADLTELLSIERRIDSLMLVLQKRPDDVGTMQALARLYVEQGWHEAAIGPLARALQLDPRRRTLWVALDRAVARSGRATITDAELVTRAAQFVEAVSMRGHGC